MREVPPLPEPEPVDPTAAPDLSRKVDETFGPDGALAGSLPSFEARDGQREMAVSVAEAFEEGGVLLAEAGTGTGKTLAYLVPAILSQHRVLVSTGTKQLQDQIYYKDLPALREALRIAFTATYMKGRSNYLCLHRFDDYKSGATLLPTGSEAFLDTIAEWARETDTGDRSEIEDLPDDLPFWGDISATSDNCIGSDCPQHQECFITRMRQRAAESDLVIVNHHLLCADAAVRQSAYGEVIPSCVHAVIDEAHQLEDVATQYFGVSVSTHRLERVVGDGRRSVERDLAPEPPGVPGGTNTDDQQTIQAALDRVEQRSTRFFAAITQHLPTADRTRLDPTLLAPVSEAGRTLASTLRGLEAAIQLAPELTEDLRAIAKRSTELADQLDFVLAASDDDYVYFLERRGRSLFLRASPVDVSTIIREVLLERMETTVLTSATLAVNGSFDYQRSRLGIRDAMEVCLPSEFDFASQTVLYLPSEMPEPREAGFTTAATNEIHRLLETTAGRAFVLFSSYANLREVHQQLAILTRFPLLVQGTAPKSVLLRDFRTTPHAVLLATSSFWQGVDVAGDTLSCVIIDKLPFAAPGDPITAARLEAITKHGGSPFDEYQVPLAILTLLQGLGRLIRHRQDRGVLSILDPRVNTKSYGRRFLDALPPSPVVQNVESVSRFLDEAGVD